MVEYRHGIHSAQSHERRQRVDCRDVGEVDWRGTDRCDLDRGLVRRAARMRGVRLLLRRGLSFPEGLEAALLLTCIPLLSPQGWDYVFLVSTPAVVLISE